MKFQYGFCLVALATLLTFHGAQAKGPTKKSSAPHIRTKGSSSKRKPFGGRSYFRRRSVKGDETLSDKEKELRRRQAVKAEQAKNFAEKRKKVLKKAKRKQFESRKKQKLARKENSNLEAKKVEEIRDRKKVRALRARELENERKQKLERKITRLNKQRSKIIKSANDEGLKFTQTPYYYSSFESWFNNLSMGDDTKGFYNKIYDPASSRRYERLLSDKPANIEHQKKAYLEEVQDDCEETVRSTPGIVLGMFKSEKDCDEENQPEITRESLGLDKENILEMYDGVKHHLEEKMEDADRKIQKMKECQRYLRSFLVTELD